MDDDLFTYNVNIPELSYSLSVDEQMGNLDNGNLDVYDRKLCYDECEKIYAKAVIFIKKRLSYKYQFKEYMEIKKQKEVYGLDAGMQYDPSSIDFNECLPFKLSNYKTMDWYTKNMLLIYYTIWDDKEDSRLTMNIKMLGYMNGTKTIHGWLICLGWIMVLGWNLVMILNMFSSHFASRIDMLSGPLAIGKRKNTNDYETQGNVGCFDEHKIIGDDDDDISDLEDYLIRKEPPYFVNEEVERSEERICKLHGIPYVKPPTWKSEKFKVVKYSFGPAE
uniref:Uncharacterized protein n=1 Tax=Tanacetum cinerariifolium TaxID=118510 RepID=A0A6L2JEB0_TANCI|nr:hypothetical protein [Tanacetum cinerariifolium]